MKYLLDTHIWIWWNSRPEALPKQVRRILDNPKGGAQFLLSVISVWEFCKLLEKGRLGISIAPEEWIEQALDQPGLTLEPLSPAIALESTRLPGAFHPDPADQIIVATARQLDATILTCDRRILDYSHVRSIE
jgi:PIN domain nuclease of toxin-antitoxin system